MSAAVAVILVLLAMVAAGSLVLMLVVVRISLRRSQTPTAAGEALGSAIRERATELVTLLVVDGRHEEVERATVRLAGLLDLDPAELRKSATRRRK